MYLVTGATGAVGRRVTRQLRAADRPVRAFVRLTSRYGELEQRGAEPFVGDLQRDRDLVKACQGVRVVVSAHGSGGGSDRVRAIDYCANLDLIDAARDAGVEHFVFLSVLGADRGYDDAPLFKAKWEVEKALRTSRLPYTIFRPCGLASSLLPLARRFRDTGLYLLAGDPRNRTSVLSPDDLARAIAAAPDCDAARNRVFPIGGPDALQRGDIPRIFSRVFGRDPIVLNPPLWAFDGVRTALGWVDNDTFRALGSLRAILANEFFCTAEETKAVAETFGFELETLETFLRRSLSGAGDGAAN